MIRTMISAFALLIAVTLAVPACAQLFPESGQVYLSFDPHRQVSTLDVLPGEPFQLWIAVDIPRVPGSPNVGIVGVEGGIALPPSVQFLEIEFPAPALNLGARFREPGLETFVVGLGGPRWDAEPGPRMGRSLSMSTQYLTFRGSCLKSREQTGCGGSRRTGFLPDPKRD